MPGVKIAHVDCTAGDNINRYRCRILKGTWQWTEFSEFFYINRFGLGPLHDISSRSDFGFEFAEIFLFEKRFPVSVSRGVDKIAYRYNYFQTFK